MYDQIKHFWHMYRGFLPHEECDHGVIFITYRLADSLPAYVLDELNDQLNRRRRELERIIIPGNAAGPAAREKEIGERLESERRQFIDHYLDRGMGSSLLKRPEIAELLVNNWHHFHGKKYELMAYTVMPNHVHILIRMFYLTEAHLPDIIHSWKSYTSHQVAKLLKNDHTYCESFPNHQLWYWDYWDRMVRDEKHLWYTMNYIIGNPVKAGLCKQPEEWQYTWWVKPE